MCGRSPLEVLASCCAAIPRQPVRAEMRPRGIPAPYMRAARAIDGDSAGGAAISNLYRELVGLIDSDPLRARVHVEEVDAEGTPDEIAEQCEVSLRRFGADRPLLIFVRE